MSDYGAFDAKRVHLLWTIESTIFAKAGSKPAAYQGTPEGTTTNAFINASEFHFGGVLAGRHQTNPSGQGLQMQSIPTPTTEQLSKLRKAAKLLVRTKRAETHAQALDEVAKAAGYHHWKHLLDVAALPGEATLPSARAYFHASSFAQPPSQDFTIFEGRSGSGKSFRATQVILDWLRDQMPVCIFDAGRSFEKLVQMLGGTRVDYDLDGAPTTSAFGVSPITLFEFENMRLRPQPEAVWKRLPPATSALEQTLLVIDEVHAIDRLFEDLPNLLEGHLDAGGSLLVLMQDPKDSKLWAKFASIKTGPEVARRRILLDRLSN